MMNLHSAVKTFFIRLSMIFVWVAIIGIFLLLPYFLQLVYQQKSITLFTWPMILDTKVLSQFERETGIKVYVNYYENNEELYAKLKLGGAGYDLIIPSDFMMEQLISDGVLVAIDKTKLNFFDQLQPHLLNHYFDPDNIYSIPYYVEILGIGINKKYFGGETPKGGWGLLFEPQGDYDISMTDVPREAIFSAGLYLYGDISSLEEKEKLLAVQNLLKKQKDWVQVYTSERVENVLASEGVPIACGLSPDVWKAMKENSDITFILPEKGSFALIHSFALPVQSKKHEYVYQLLNFLYRPDIIKQNSLLYGFYPPIKNVSVESEGILSLSEDLMAKMHFFKNSLSTQQIQDMWISILG